MRGGNVMLYQCENCYNTQEKEEDIHDCNECGDECCIVCAIESKGEYYCSQHCADCND